LICIIEWLFFIVHWWGLLPRGLIISIWLLPPLVIPSLTHIFIVAPTWINDNQLGDGCEDKIWDPGTHEDQHWEPMVCEELHQSLEILILNDGAYWKSKHWWKFQDEYKYKPP